MEAFLSSVALVALSEMGDKTQLLAFALASRYRRPWTVMLGILVATVANHALAAWAGIAATRLVGQRTMAWIVAISFLAFAVWILKPDSLDDDTGSTRWGPLMTTIVLFFIAEMGDKTQLATVALGAKYDSGLAVVCGTTLGMLIANGLAVALGEGLKERVSFDLMRYISAGLFALMGVATALGALWVG